MAAKSCTFTPNPLKGFRQCAVQALPPPPPPFVDSPTALLLVVAFASAMGYALHNTFPCHGKRCGCLSGWQRELAEVLESAPFVGCVVLLILVDLACTFYTSVVAEEGELVEWAEWIGFRCLVFFLAEQALHYLAFGNPWLLWQSVVCHGRVRRIAHGGGRAQRGAPRKRAPDVCRHPAVEALCVRLRRGTGAQRGVRARGEVGGAEEEAVGSAFIPCQP